MKDPVLNTDELVVVETDTSDLVRTIVYARDNSGNIWRTLATPDFRPKHWALYRRAEDVKWPTPSVDDVIRMHEQQQKKEEPNGTLFIK